MEYTEKHLVTNQINDRITQLEEENRALKTQLQQNPENVLQTKPLNSLFAHGKEVVLYVINDEYTTIEAISDSISSYGYSPDEFTSGKFSFRDMIYADDLQHAIEYINGQLKKGIASFDQDYRIISKSSDPTWVTCVTIPEYNSAGIATHFLVKIKDISKHKQNENELQDVHESLLVTLRNIDEAVIFTDIDGYIDRLNATAAKLVGMVNPKVRHKLLGNVIRFSLTSDFSKPINPVEIKEEPRKAILYDNIFMQCDSSYNLLHVSCNVLPIYIGKNKNILIGYVLVIKDLDSTSNMWQKWLDSEVKIRDNESHGHETIVLTPESTGQNQQKPVIRKDQVRNPDNHFSTACLFCIEINKELRKLSFSYLNETWEKLTNTNIEDALKDINTFLSKVYPDDLQSLLDKIWNNPDTQDIFDTEFRYLYHENDMRWFHISSHTHNENGHLMSDGFIIDITQQKLTENSLIIAKEKAEEADMLKSMFLANMSHEIRTPLNGIIGFLNLLASDSLPPKRQQEYITLINNSGAQLVKLIDDIIDVAKIEAKQMSICPVPFHINELLAELQTFFETYLKINQKDRVTLILDDSQAIDSCVTYVDPMRLRQILSNLISNAIKFTEKGYIRFGYRQSAPGQLEFVVEDSGIGLAPDQLGVIFERFRQVELNNNRRYGGTGLGLTISRNLAQLMGGDMHVESIEGIGSFFYFTISYLPVSIEDEYLFDKSSGEKSHLDKPLKDKTVLIIEPEILKYKLYDKLLSATGASTIQANNLQQGCNYMGKSYHFDAVITGISTFNNADQKFISQFKSLQTNLPVIIIVPPGYKDEHRQMINHIQYNTTLEEPINCRLLANALKEHIAQSHVS